MECKEEVFILFASLLTFMSIAFNKQWHKNFFVCISLIRSLPENIFVDVNSTSTCLYADKHKKLLRLDVRIMKIFFVCACLDVQTIVMHRTIICQKIETFFSCSITVCA